MRDRLCKARELAGLSQCQACTLMGIDIHSLKQVELGNREASTEEIAKLAQLYRVSESWLSGEGDEQANLLAAGLPESEIAKLNPADLEAVSTIVASIRKS